MIKQHIPITILACSLATPFSVYAGDDSKDSKVALTPVVPPAPVCSTRQVKPLYSHYAQTARQWTLRGSYRYFEGANYQEIDSVDGSLIDFDLVVPLSERWQMRLYFPVYTDATATRIDTNEDVTLKGDGGLLDFPSIAFDYQFKQAQSEGDWNMAVYFGGGTVLISLDEKNKVTGGIDVLNHRGSMVQLGFKADTQWNHCLTFIGNLGGRYHWESDDIHPGGGSDVFFLMEASAAVIYNPANAWAYPMLEIAYQESFDTYSNIQIAPQVVIPVGEHLDVNLGVSFGVLDDGPRTEARAQVSYRF